MRLNTNGVASFYGDHDVLLYTRQNYIVETYNMSKQAFGEKVLSPTQTLWSGFEGLKWSALC
jgi:hypothetical protein